MRASLSAVVSICVVSVTGSDTAFSDERAAAPPVVVEAPPRETAEDPLAENSVFVEGFGAAVFYSFNYERMLLDRLGLRVGFSFLPRTGGGDYTL
jgi:hypothetical protein